MKRGQEAKDQPSIVTERRMTRALRLRVLRTRPLRRGARGDSALMQRRMMTKWTARHARPVASGGEGDQAEEAARAGLMLAFMEKKLAGSYLALS